MNGLIFIQLFFKKKINCWPRGLPLNEINNNKIEFKNLKKIIFIYNRVFVKETQMLMQYFD